jgi:putative FmdB family regulatory protein
MPIYEYKCKSCGHVSEVLVQGFFSPREPECPECGQEMERLITSPSLLKNTNNSGKTCCGREERCEKPPCSSEGHCRRN